MPHTSEDIFLKRIGKRLKSLRQSAGLTQVQLAKTVELDYRHYQNLEAGLSNFKITTIKKLADFFAVDIALFFQGDLSPQTLDLGDVLLGRPKAKFFESELDGYRERWNSLPVPVLVVDVPGNIRFLNITLREQIKLSRGAELEIENNSVHVSELSHGEDAKAYVRSYHSFLMREMPPAKPYFDASYHKSGSPFIVRADCAYLLDSNHRAAGNIAVIRPIANEAFSDASINSVTH